MQFGPCIHCGRIILLVNRAQACGTCHILSTEEEEENEQMANDDTYTRNNQESNDIYFDQNDNHTAATTAATDNTMERPNVMDIQTAVGREDLPQMLQQFLSFFNQNDGQQQQGASDSEIAALDRHILDIHDSECETECAICTELFETMELIKLPCNHEYHSECIHHWLKLNSSCPMCRQSISDNKQQQQQQQQQRPVPSTQDEPDLIIMRREIADRMYRENAPLHYMDDVD